MKTHTIEVTGISDDLLKRLDERARQAGRDRAEYVCELLVKDLQAPTLREILAPFRQQVKESGITDEELDALFIEQESAVQEGG